MIKLKDLIFEGKLSSISQINDTIKTEICVYAQQAYNEWNQNEEGYDEELGTGGICQIVADEMLDVLHSHGIYNVQTQCSDDPHVYLIGKFKEGIFTIDIPYHVYESGGGWSWKKKPDVKFDVHHVIVWRLDPSYRKWKKYTDYD